MSANVGDRYKQGFVEYIVDAMTGNDLTIRRIDAGKSGSGAVPTLYTHDEMIRMGYTHIPSAAAQTPAAPAQVYNPNPAYQQATGGILSWLPTKTPSAAPGPLSTSGLWFLQEDPAPKKTTRQVSHNGKDWVDYRHLLDADDFESYKYRREI